MVIKDINKRREYAKLSMRRFRAKNIATQIPRDYSNAVVYKIYCLDLSIAEFYIGSTVNFTRRQTEHRLNSKPEYNYSNKLYECIRLNGGWINWKMVNIEKCEVSNRDELLDREYYWYQTLKPLLNSKVIKINNKTELITPTESENIKLIITELYQFNFNKVLIELTNKSILPRHIYLFKPVLKDLLVSYFKKRIIKINNRTELIILSHLESMELKISAAVPFTKVDRRSQSLVTQHH